MPNVFPVIHVYDTPHGFAQGSLALSLGADGVFVISHTEDNDQLGAIMQRLKEKFPEKKIGVNYLGTTVKEALTRGLADKADMLWVDNSGIHSSCVSEEALLLSKYAQDHAWDIFASVAFKYQPHDQNPGLAACKAALLGLIPTTSGPATGMPPDFHKTKSMRSRLNSLPERASRLALASGASCDNLLEFKSHVTDFLVATGVSSDFHTLDPDKLAAFLRLAKS